MTISIQNLRKALAVVVCAPFFITVLTSCGGREPDGTQNAEMELPVATINTGDAVITQKYAGSIEGVVNVEIRPQVSGYLQKIYVDEGSFVRQGQPLFKIDERVFVEQYNSAKGALLAAKANLTNAKLEVDKRNELVKNKIVSDLQITQAKASYQAAEAAVAQAEAALQSAQINLDFCTIKAPVSGYTGRIPYRLGSLISASQATALTILSDVHEVYVYFSMSENDFVAFQNRYKGSSMEEKLTNVPPVKLQLSDGTEFAEAGRLNAVEGQFDRNTGSITLRAVFPNAKGLLRSGNTGKVLIDQQYAQVALVPIASTSSIQNKVYVFKLDKGNKVIQQAIEVSGKSGLNYMVAQGVQAGDRIVSSGFERLQPGMIVKPQTKEPDVAGKF